MKKLLIVLTVVSVMVLSWGVAGATDKYNLSKEAKESSSEIERIYNEYHDYLKSWSGLEDRITALEKRVLELEDQILRRELYEEYQEKLRY